LLLEHLTETPYDVAVFIDAGLASTAAGIDAVASRMPTVVVPLAAPSPKLALPVVREALDRATVILATSRAEAALVGRIAPATKVEVVGSVLRVHDLARRNEPLLYEKDRVVVVGDWETFPAPVSLVLLVRRLNDALGDDVGVRLVGPGWESLPDDVRAAHAESRFDTWRWVCRAIAVWDPTPDRLLGRDVLESLAYGTPVITHARGASREHAEGGDGGLWYRNERELLRCIRELADRRDAAATLGAQGRAYAEREFGDPKAFVARVEAVLDAVVG
jgi:glycosyltransferase involved in cell wall biosynthesis